MNITIILTPQEKDCLLGLIDLATKAGGLNVAVNAVFLAQKIQAAANPPSEVIALPEKTE